MLSTPSLQISSFVVEGEDSEVVKGSTNEGTEKARALLFTQQTSTHKMLVVTKTASEKWINTRLSERGYKLFMTERNFYSD